MPYIANSSLNAAHRPVPSTAANTTQRADANYGIDALTMRTLLPHIVTWGQGLNRDELYVNLGCLRECAQVAGI
jgi:hypothetical protein